MTNNNLIQALEWRYAVKQFDATKKIPAQTWETLEQALILTPSSYGLQPWKFLNVQDKGLREKLRAQSWGQSQVTDASHFVVFLGKTAVSEKDIDSFILKTAEVRGAPKEALKGYRDMMVGDLVQGPRSKIAPEWAARQAYIALGNLMTVAASLQVDSCPMEGLDPAQYDEILGLNNSGYRTLCALALGYRSSDDKYATAKKVRYSKEQLIEVR
jgi:nitroreductase